MQRARRQGCDGGAAAVEFALVVPVLLLLVFGIIDYGIYFADSLAVRSGVREAARQGVVLNCNPTPFNQTCLADLTKNRIDPIAGGAQYVKIVTPQGWTRGKDLVVCAIVKVDGATGFTPLPNNNTTRAKVTMRIEQDQPAQPTATYVDLPPPGDSWDFCA